MTDVLLAVSERNVNVYTYNLVRHSQAELMLAHSFLKRVLYYVTLHNLGANSSPIIYVQPTVVNEMKRSHDKADVFCTSKWANRMHSPYLIADRSKKSGILEVAYPSKKARQ